jgi:hypothetical protein
MFSVRIDILPTVVIAAKPALVDIKKSKKHEICKDCGENTPIEDDRESNRDITEFITHGTCSTYHMITTCTTMNMPTPYILLYRDPTMRTRFG